MPFLIKICGVTTPADAEMVARFGATAVGVNFWRGSKRYAAAAAADIFAALPPEVLKFGVFVNAPAAVVRAHVDRLGLDRVQLHGDEHPDDFADFPSQLIVPVVRVRDPRSLTDGPRWLADVILYDAFVEAYGGAGVAAPWGDIAALGRAPFLLAGGLDADNVGEAIRATRPAGVDVASGVELAPGRKDPARVAAFVAAAREASRDLGLSST